MEGLVSIVIPAYNEEEAIGDDLDGIIAAMEGSGRDYEIIVVDDGSQDRTAEMIRARPQVRLVQHASNRGVGAARNTGVRQAQGEVIAMTDGDGSYPNQEIPTLISHLEGCDMVVGARSREHGRMSWLRWMAKTFIRLLASYLVEAKIPDLNSGLRVMRRELIERYWHILPRGHSWVSTITLALLSDGYNVKFVPIDYYPRRGRSSFHPLSDTYNYILLVIRTIMYFNPLKVLLPLSLVFLSAGIIRQFYQFIVVAPKVFSSNVLLVVAGMNLGVMGLLADLIVRRVRQGSGR
jgi:glycosyltransferase involved in cell wall biosynthesis